MSEAITDEKSIDALCWHSPLDAPFHVAGLAWFAQERLYRRFPKLPPYPLPEAVEFLADYPSGAQIRFQTTSRRLSVRVRLTPSPGSPHMSAIGQGGIDCYLGAPGQQRFAGVTKFDYGAVEYTCELCSLTEPALRHVTLNLPLYQGVEEVHVGLEPAAEVLPPAPYANDHPIIVYGTSITQGGCASRPGMAYTNILSRRLNREFINMGFSGSGKGEPEVARNIASIPDPGGFVLDYELNTSPEILRATLVNFIGILREAHPAVPILVLSAIRYADEVVNDGLRDVRKGNREFQQDTVASLRAQGDAGIYFQDGAPLLGDDFYECSVDGGHPTDLGFLRMANALEPVIRKIL